MPPPSVSATSIRFLLPFVWSRPRLPLHQPAFSGGLLLLWSSIFLLITLLSPSSRRKEVGEAFHFCAFFLVPDFSPDSCRNSFVSFFLPPALVSSSRTTLALALLRLSDDRLGFFWVKPSPSRSFSLTLPFGWPIGPCRFPLSDLSRSPLPIFPGVYSLCRLFSLLHLPHARASERIYTISSPTCLMEPLERSLFFPDHPSCDELPSPRSPTRL